jgi:hypothetical protein
MNKQNLLLLLVSLTMLVFSCKDVDDGTDNVDTNNAGQVLLTGSITQNTTLTSNTKYLINGFVYVESGATLTIEPGTIIKGDKDTKGSLIVKPGGKLMAEGTASEPIVFTSNQPKGSRGYGDWGGIILLGNATVNKNPATIEGENLSTFGGTNDNDNSGILKYVRIEFAGIAFETDKEINGLTLGGVGRGTTLSHIQVSYSGDDAFEWFGGNVDADHLISFRTLDDDFDTDNGFSGNVQFGFALRDPNIADQCTCSSSNGFESDNDGSGTDATPITSASFANFSIFLGQGSVNSKYNDGVLIRRNSAISLYNSVVIGGYPKAGLEFNGTGSQANYVNGLSNIKGLVLCNMNVKTLTTDSTTFYHQNSNNFTNYSISDLTLNNMYNDFTAPKPQPLAGSPLLSNGTTLPAQFTSTNYIGAFKDTDWTTGWANFDPQYTDYP